MKKKLTRSSFSALRETATLLDEQEQRAVIGGDYWDDHGYWQTDASGGMYWTRTSLGNGYYYGDSGYYGGSGYSGYSGYGTGSGIITQDQFFNWQGDWPGGYVEGMGYVPPDTIIYGGSGYYNGSGYNDDSGYYGGSGYSGNSSNLYTISPVLSASDFSGYQTSDSAGCQRRCVEMLACADVSMDGSRINMVSDVNGRAGNALSTANQGIDAINAALENGDPIIVGVDYKKGNYNGGFEDHFIVIVGRTVSSDGSVQYLYFDPRTGDQSIGTSSDNILTLTADGKLTGTFPGSQNNYTVTSVRTNK
jgi:hypothetical protein